MKEFRQQSPAKPAVTLLDLVTRFAAALRVKDHPRPVHTPAPARNLSANLETVVGLRSEIHVRSYGSTAVRSYMYRHQAASCSGWRRRTRVPCGNDKGCNTDPARATTAARLQPTASGSRGRSPARRRGTDGHRSPCKWADLRLSFTRIRCCDKQQGWPLGMQRLEQLAQLSLGDWVSALKLGPASGILSMLDEWGVAEPADMIYLEQSEVELLSADLKLIQKRKLEKAIETLARQAGMSPDDLPQIELPAPPPEVLPVESGSDVPSKDDKVEMAPEIREPAPPDDTEFAGHCDVLGAYATQAGSADDAAVLKSIHRCWTGCVAVPARRNRVLPSLFRIARENTGSDLEREAAIALVFLAFSLSGTTVDVHSAAVDSKSGSDGEGPTTVLILGWLGSGNSDFDEVVKHYRATYGCKVVVTVGGNDLWPGHPIATTGSTAPPPRPSGLATAMSGAAPWPGSQLADAQLASLAEEMTGSRVLIHSFSNNGIMLYTRLLRHLTREQDANRAASPSGGGGRLCSASLKLASIAAVVIDSSPDPSYDRNLLKQVCVLPNILTHSILHSTISTIRYMHNPDLGLLLGFLGSRVRATL
eukprot:COSAG05_NODE_648_length_8105_cov_23.780914_6_plen_591_part_00